MERKNPIEEAKRYLQNAKDILRDKAVKDGNSYTDSKYVKMAGDTAWKGCLIALDAVFHVRESLPKGRRVSVEDYRDRVARTGRCSPALWMGTTYFTCTWDMTVSRATRHARTASTTPSVSYSGARSACPRAETPEQDMAAGFPRRFFLPL